MNSKKRIGLITYTHGENFGQRLQNYALQEFLVDKGFEIETIRQSSPYGIARKIKDCLKVLINFIKNPVEQKSIRIRRNKFRIFNNKYIRFYKKTIPFYGKNNNLHLEFNAFVVGSDQIWNPYSLYARDNAFLTFAKDGQKFSYAPSMSVDIFPNNAKEYYRERLKDFSLISVREDRSASILYDITGRAIRVVVDPTLLLNRERWDEIREDTEFKPKKKYIVCYFLGKVPESFLKRINATFKEIVFLSETSAISPCEFVDLIADAECVLTDSYHGTIFAAIYNVDFYNYERKIDGLSMSTRFETLYRWLGITDRMFNYDYIPDGSSAIDYATVNSNIEKPIKESMSFLEEVSRLID